MSKLSDFRGMIDDIENVETLQSGYEVLSDLVSMISLKNEILKLEEGLTDGGKAMFYFFAKGLTDEELPFATEKIKGKITRLNREQKDNSEQDSGEE